MTTNGQQMVGDYFTTTANVMGEMFAQETEEWMRFVLMRWLIMRCFKLR